MPGKAAAAHAFRTGGDGGAFQQTFVLSPAGVSDRNIVGIGFYGEHIKLHHGSFGGWQPFGPARKVTRCSGNILFELDGVAVPTHRQARGVAHLRGSRSPHQLPRGVDDMVGLLAQIPDDGRPAILLAHELGHFRHRHIIQRIVALFAMSLLGFALLGWLSTQAWFYTGLGVRPNMGAPNDALALLLFLLAVPVFTFFVSPLFAQLSRKHEFQADAFAVTQTSGQDLSTALLKLYEDNASTLTPDPVFVKFYYSHPPASERLARMNA